jgi:hypothetical protein
MIDLKAPIAPGVGAAGIRIGMDIRDVLSNMSLPLSAEHLPDGSMVYRSQSVDVWVEDRKIVQIMVHGQYEGRLLNHVGIGSTLDEVRAYLGSVDLDEEDNMVVKERGGFCFEIDPDARPSRVTAIYVFSV